MPVRMSNLLEDLFRLAGIVSKKKPSITQISVRDEVVFESRIETFPEFVKLYPFARAYYVEFLEPNISGMGEAFKVTSLGIYFKRINDEWEPRVHIKEQEITSDMIEKLLHILEERKKEIVEIALLVWKIVQSMKG